MTTINRRLRQDLNDLVRAASVFPGLKSATLNADDTIEIVFDPLFSGAAADAPFSWLIIATSDYPRGDAFIWCEQTKTQEPISGSLQDIVLELVKRRDPNFCNSAAAAVASAAAAMLPKLDPRPVLFRPAILSSIFKFLPRPTVHCACALANVNSTWEDAILHHSDLFWRNASSRTALIAPKWLSPSSSSLVSSSTATAMRENDDDVVLDYALARHCSHARVLHMLQRCQTEYVKLRSQHVMAMALQFVRCSRDGKCAAAAVLSCRTGHRRMMPALLAQKATHQTVDFILRDACWPGDDQFASKSNSGQQQQQCISSVHFDFDSVAAYNVPSRLHTTLGMISMKLSKSIRSLVIGGALSKQDEQSVSQQEQALCALLPRSLQCLDFGCGAFAVGAAFTRQLQTQCPHLESLRLTVSTADGVQELFSRAQNFPMLRHLSVELEEDAAASTGLYHTIFDAPLTKKLATLETRYRGNLKPVRGAVARYSNERGDPVPAPSLRGLAGVKNLHRLLCHVRLDSSSPPDFSELESCSSMRDFLFGSIFVPFNLGVSVDLSGCSSLRHLGPNMLCACRGVRTLRLPPTIVSIGPSFCIGSSIDCLDLAPVAGSLKVIDSTRWLQNCEYLSAFDTSPLAGTFLKGRVGESFMRCCSELTFVNLSGLRGVFSVDDHFLDGAVHLQVVEGMEGFANVVRVGSDFMAQTPSLESCDFSKMVSLRRLGAGALCTKFSRQHTSKVFDAGLRILEEIVENNNEKKKR